MGSIKNRPREVDKSYTKSYFDKKLKSASENVQRTIIKQTPNQKPLSQESVNVIPQQVGTAPLTRGEVINHNIQEITPNTEKVNVKVSWWKNWF